MTCYRNRPKSSSCMYHKHHYFYSSLRCRSLRDHICVHSCLPSILHHTQCTCPFAYYSLYLDSEAKHTYCHSCRPSILHYSSCTCLRLCYRYHLDNELSNNVFHSYRPSILHRRQCIFQFACYTVYLDNEINCSCFHNLTPSSLAYTPNKFHWSWYILDSYYVCIPCHTNYPNIHTHIQNKNHRLFCMKSNSVQNSSSHIVCPIYSHYTNNISNL